MPLNKMLCRETGGSVTRDANGELLVIEVLKRRRRYSQLLRALVPDNPILVWSEAPPEIYLGGNAPIVGG
jgi:hypothetical protein